MDGQGVAQTRRLAGVGQRQLAEALGISPQRLSDIEREYLPSPEGFNERVTSALERILRDRLAAVAGRR